jgi:hypothetical protein
MTLKNSSSQEGEEVSRSSSSSAWTFIKTVAACAFLVSATITFAARNSSSESFPRRQLTMVGESVPSYMDPLMKELRDRKKLFEETPPEEVKYWFEYTGPLQVSAAQHI